MSDVTLNGGPVSGLKLNHSQSGVWWADVAIQPSVGVPEGKVTIDVFGTAYVGTVVRAGTSRGTPMARVLGGAGGLGTELPPRAYRGVDGRLALSETLAAAGEVLAPSSDATALSAFLPHWARRRGKAGEALALLLRALGIPAWRVLADGTVWVGTETWPASALTDYRLLVEDPHVGRYEVYAETPNIFPGEVWGGMQVSVVEHRFTAHDLRTSIWVHT